MCVPGVCVYDTMYMCVRVYACVDDCVDDCVDYCVNDCVNDWVIMVNDWVNDGLWFFKIDFFLCSTCL